MAIAAMAYSLLDNPFAVLGLAASATPQQIIERAREIGTEEADRAKQALLVLRPRFEAELFFLPGAGSDIVRRTLDALRADRPPESRFLSVPARANLLAHLAFSGKVDPALLRELADLVPCIAREVWVNLITADRTAAGVRAPNETWFDKSLAALADVHGGALVAGLRSLGEAQGADLLVDLVNKTEAGHLGFLHKAAAGWERGAASKAIQLEEEAARLEQSLATKATATAAKDLADVVRTWAKLTGPKRAIDAKAGLPDEATEQRVGRWRELAVDIVNDQEAIRESLIIVRALVDAFASLPDFGDLLRDDLKTCQELVKEAEESERLGPLQAAIAEAAAQRETLRSSLTDGGPTSSALPVVVRLRAALLEAAQAIPGERPWLLFRAFTLQLHNKFQMTAAALSLTRLAAAAANLPTIKAVAGCDIIEQLEADIRVLERELASRELDAALKANEARRAIIAIDRLLALGPDAEQAKKLHELRQALDRQLSERRLKSDRLGPLQAAIAEAEAQRQTLRYSLNGEEPTSIALPVVVRLRAALLEAAQAVPGERPWLLLRAFTLRLHNEFQMTAAALSLTRLAAAAAHLPTIKAVAGRDVIEQLEADIRALERELASRELEGALKADQTTKAIALIDRLLALGSDAEQAAKLRQLRQALDARLRKRRLKIGLAGAAAALLAWIFIQPEPSGRAAPPHAAPSSVSPPSRPYFDQSEPAPPKPKRDNRSASRSSSRAYLDGQADKRSWNTWFGSLSGDYRDGAEYWASVRSNRKPGSCYGLRGERYGNWTAGCLAAQQRLNPSDRRRRAEREYRAGWNSLKPM